MDREIELAPLGQAISAGQKSTSLAERKDGTEAKSNVSVASDGRKRSNLRMAAILTALFVR